MEPQRKPGQGARSGRGFANYGRLRGPRRGASAGAGRDPESPRRRAWAICAAEGCARAFGDDDLLIRRPRLLAAERGIVGVIGPERRRQDRSSDDRREEPPDDGDR